jgi:hypothetical protein
MQPHLRERYGTKRWSRLAKIQTSDLIVGAIEERHFFFHMYSNPFIRRNHRRPSEIEDAAPCRRPPIWHLATLRIAESGRNPELYAPQYHHNCCDYQREEGS